MTRPATGPPTPSSRPCRPTDPPPLAPAKHDSRCQVVPSPRYDSDGAPSMPGRRSGLISPCRHTDTALGPPIARIPRGAYRKGYRSVSSPGSSRNGPADVRAPAPTPTRRPQRQHAGLKDDLPVAVVSADTGPRGRSVPRSAVHPVVQQCGVVGRMSDGPGGDAVFRVRRRRSRPVPARHRGPATSPNAERKRSVWSAKRSGGADSPARIG